jgi:glucan phosphoethanolaminetransferase (alkaline phosphatase superfamily)
LILSSRIGTVKENHLKEHRFMLTWVHYLLFVVMFLFMLSSIFYSFRYRTQKDPKARGVNAARMNMSMGVVLVALSVIQLVLFDLSLIRLVFGVILLLMGLFNLFAGIRNHAHFSSM